MLTAQQLDTQTIPIYLGTNDAVLDADRTAYSPTFLIGYNNAYQFLCRKHGLAKAWQEITLSATKTYALSSLTNKIIGQPIVVAQYQDGTASANYGEAMRYDWILQDGVTLIVPEVAVSSKVWIYYEYSPALLVNPYPVTGGGHTAGEGATSPSLLPDQYLIALSYAACAEAAVTIDKNPGLAQLWLDKFTSATRSLVSTMSDEIENTTGW
jgi:hypothetical protein